MLLIIYILFVAITAGAFPVHAQQATESAGPAIPEVQQSVLSSTPEWAKEAIWYQIFVERFRNGDKSNDPRLKDIEGSWPHIQPSNWEVTPWDHPWYTQEQWAKQLGRDFYYTVQLRRYGGDLQGVINKLDYIKELGATAIYLNPINDAPSLHKYDARNYRHIDRNFGPDPEGDIQIMERETPENPDTWEWTSADSLFLKLVDEIHKRDMRVILDYSWNHTGITFWAWKHVLEHQQDSPYADWYMIEEFDDPATKKDEFAYKGWAGVKTLPELKKVDVENRVHGKPYQGDLHPEVKQHIFNVTRRWLDPNGDGDPSDGIDGFRLDVAEQIPMGFWRDYRKFVRSINPKAYLVGEIWWENWPDKMMDPKPYLQGDVFDAVMHYRWYMPTRSYIADAKPEMDAVEYASHIDSIYSGIERQRLLAMMNVTATHDSPRLSTSLYNKGQYKYNVKPADNPDYKIEKPGKETLKLQKMLLINQYTFPGAPHIWNGDEVGMWGPDDPDNRKPMVWRDKIYQQEQNHPLGKERKPDVVAANYGVYSFHKQLARLRKDNSALVDGKLNFIHADPVSNTLVYERFNNKNHFLILFNASEYQQMVTIDLMESDKSFRGKRHTWKTIINGNKMHQSTKRKLIKYDMPPHTAEIWKLK